eukprot:m.160869 g.160869  ORF g.160869 m.160869 type:complete len:153 (-) comp12000_c0_seq1:362-820(-)
MLTRCARLAVTTASRAAGSAAVTASAVPSMRTARWITAESRKSLDELVHSNDIVVFMKGSPDAPQCGFSRTVCVVLDMHGVSPDNYVAKDVLSDSTLRSDIKEYSEWPTVPQVYIKGEFLGGCDIVVDMHNSGELVEVLKSVGHQSTWAEEE